MTYEIDRSMSLSAVLKGRLAERILTTLLERGGYRVTRLGIEELFDEVKLLPLRDYLSLRLPKGLRFLPDLLVADAQVTWAVLVEVKFRRRFDREAAAELYDTLSEQQQYWPEAWTIIMIGEPFHADHHFHQDYIRTIPPGKVDLLRNSAILNAEMEEGLRMRSLWDSLPMMTRLFRTDWERMSPEEQKREKNFWQGADYVTTAVKDLAKL